MNMGMGIMGMGIFLEGGMGMDMDIFPKHRMGMGMGIFLGSRNSSTYTLDDTYPCASYTRERWMEVGHHARRPV